ncbi:MAG: phasin family protein [Beijerinckiaceae bacterium]|nr:phasin family protein [Beijerinckiaceae bacterium]
MFGVGDAHLKLRIQAGFFTCRGNLGDPRPLTQYPSPRAGGGHPKFAEETMGQNDQQATPVDAAASAMESAVSAINATSKKMQAVASECFEASKESFEHASQTLEKLRGAHGVEEIMAIQANYVKEAFENAAEHARKFGELMSVFPNEFTKTYQEAWLKAVDAAVKTMQSTSKTASDSVESYTEAARKSTRAFNHRESA